MVVTDPMSAHETEIDDLARRARELRAAIQRERDELRALQGLPPEGAARGERRGVLETELELSPLDPETAHPALFDAIHRATGLVGAVRTRGDDLSWRVFDEQLARRKLEVDLEGPLDAPRLRVRDAARSAGGRVRWILAVAFVGFLAAVALIMTIGLGNPALAAIGVLVAMLFTLAGVVVATRRASSAALRALAHEIGDALPARAGVRVEVEGPDEAEAHEVELQAEEARRGVS